MWTSSVSKAPSSKDRNLLLQNQDVLQERKTHFFTLLLHPFLFLSFQNILIILKLAELSQLSDFRKVLKEHVKE